MRKIFAVYKREVALYFRSPIAYGIGFALLLFFGILYGSNVSNATYYNQQAAQYGQAANATADLLVQSNLSTFMVLMFVIGPLLTMRLLAEETREGTLEVLMTLPMGESTFIIGKFLAAWTYYLVLLLLTLVYVFVLSTFSQLDIGILLASYFGAGLYGGAVLALSMIWSAVTEDQILAAFLGAATVLLLFLAEQAAGWAAGQEFTANAVEFIRELSLQAHYHATMLQGIVRGQDVAYFLLIIVGALFLTTRIVETRRWRA